jgi:archaeosine-15-forming tRNA-guanine transglycosylase
MQPQGRSPARVILRGEKMRVIIKDKSVEFVSTDRVATDSFLMEKTEADEVIILETNDQRHFLKWFVAHMD